MKRTKDETILAQKSKKSLGKEISGLRKKKGISMRKMADCVKIPPSNLKYIEDGVNAPSPGVYDSLIRQLQPTQEHRNKMDALYSSIRGAPPPDVCQIMIKNDGMNDAIRLLEDVELTAERISKMKALVLSFLTTNQKEKEL